MEQAGIYKIDLYENYDISFSLESSSKATSIATSGQTINIDNCQRPNFKQVYNKGNNRKLIYNYELTYTIFDFSIANIQEINSIKSSPFGFIPVITYYNEYQQILLDPLFLDGTINFNSANSHNFNLLFRNNIEGANNNNTNGASNKRLIEFELITGFLLINDTEPLYINSIDKLLIN